MADYRNDGRIKPQCHSPSDTTYCRGMFFLLFGQYKVFGTHFTMHGRSEKSIQSFIIEGAYPWMKPILEEIILPHARIRAFLTAYGELMIGGPHTPCLCPLSITSALRTFPPPDSDYMTKMDGSSSSRGREHSQPNSEA
jgi:hypothetical protein